MSVDRFSTIPIGRNLIAKDICQYGREPRSIISCYFGQYFPTTVAVGFGRRGSTSLWLQHFLDLFEVLNIGIVVFGARLFGLLPSGDKSLGIALLPAIAGAGCRFALGPYYRRHYGDEVDG